ncbi:ComEC/Rec2 family competence protein [Sphingomonas sp. 28-63-12]|uniref:ComEC/Rec2 family competence protein n=1 Tax=Sphingomonas sp. 28-63-12 TaxID=1970434 RepID=UPI0035A81CE0
MLGLGVAAWLWLPDSPSWITVLLALAATALLALAVDRGGRGTRVVVIACAAMSIGMALIWTRAERVSSAPLAEPVIVRFEARVERVEPLPPRGLVRLRLAPSKIVGWLGRASASGLPRHLRLNLQAADFPAGLSRGAVILLSARLVPPPPPSVPGAYDYARVAWFDGIGATGRGFGPIVIVSPGDAAGGGLRARLSAHIRSQVSGGAGAIAAALATGDQGAIPLDDAEAMRRAGLTHLLSVSGLHITAVVGIVMMLVLRLLALSPWLALHWRLPLIAAGAGAVAAIGYTILTGAEVPTVRSCVAALMVLLAVALGREAVTLRLVATGAIIVLLFWPEALAGPSFQLSFAAVTAIIALHEAPRVKRWFAARDESRAAWLARQLASLLLTGIVVEAALSPIAFYHFHKSGLYGSVANIVAIPLTTFVVMPIEALALLFDLVGLGWPFWWLVGQALGQLLAMAHLVANAPGAVAALPAMPDGAYALMVVGGLWLALWRTRIRLVAALPIVIGAGWAVLTPPPDLLVTADGRHLALRTDDGDIALLRDRAGDYTRMMLAENAGIDGEPTFLAEQRAARCSRDLCLADRMVGGRRWRIIATRSAYPVPSAALIAACLQADIVISERRLPRRCRPLWLRLDRPILAETGGIAITLGSGRIVTVRQAGDRHPWRLSAPSVTPRQ